MERSAVVWLVLFGIAAVGQLIAVYTHNLVWRRINKPFIVTTLILFYLAVVRPPDIVFVAALVCGLAGDILLLFPKLFKLGGACFLAGHICYITVFSRDIVAGAVAPHWPVVAAVCYSLAIVLWVILIKKGSRAWELAVLTAYLIALGMMSCAALLRWWSLGTTGSLLVFAGSLLFMASDFTIMLRNFRKDIKIPKVDFIVMATYAPAQLLICLGMSVLR